MKKNCTLLLTCLFISILSAQPTKVVLVEEGTGTWCQWCPRGDIYGQTLAEDYPNNSLFVAIHQGDPMENLDYYNNANFSGLPNGNIDRTFQSDLDPFFELQQDMAQQLALTPPAAVSVATTWDAATRDMTMTVSAEFAENVNAEYRLAAIVVEDGVTGPSPSYDQSNSYSGGDNGPMGGYESLPSPVSASVMVYNHVGRYLAGGYGGAANSLPMTISDGETHSYTYDWNLPADYNEEYVYVIGVLINTANGQILNAGGSNYLPGFSNGKPFFHSNPQTQGFVGLNYNYDILTHDPEHDDLVITAISSLPNGLTLTDLGDGKAELSGTPTDLGTYQITLNVTDGEWNIEQTFELEIGEPEEDWIQIGEVGFSPLDVDAVDIEVNSAGESYVMYTNNDLMYVYKFDGDTWIQQGNAVAGGSFHSSMAVGADVPYVFGNGIVSKLVDGTWEQVGAALPGGQYIFTDIIIDGNETPFVVYFAPPSTTNAYKFNGTDWEVAGTLTDGVAVWNRFQLDHLGNPIVIYGTDGSSILYSEAAQWDGDNWNLLGGGYIEPNSQTYFDHDISVTDDGKIFAALTIGVGAQNLNIYELIDDSWELINENITDGATEDCNLEADNEGNIIAAFRDENNGGRTSAMKYDGNDWNYLGLAGFTDIASRQSLAVDGNGIPFVAYRDENAGGKMSVKKFEDLTDGVFQIPLANYQLNIFPNPTNGQFILEYEKGEAYQILDVSGKLIQEGKLEADFLNDNLSYKNLNMNVASKGIYFVKVIGQEGIQTKRLIKE